MVLTMNRLLFMCAAFALAACAAPTHVPFRTVERAPIPGSVFRDCDDVCPEMVMLPQGSFTMGSPDSDQDRSSAEVPQHRVSISYPLAVGKYDVTRGEYAAYVKATGHADGSPCGTEAIPGYAKFDKDSDHNWHSPGFDQTVRDPVVCVSWDDAQAYVQWLSEKTGRTYRLLSESEYEYAARAGTTTTRYWGEHASNQCAYANGGDQALDRSFVTKTVFTFADCTDGYVFTSPVGSFPPNAFGLYDMLGDAHSWTQDCWNETYSGAPTDGSSWQIGDCSQRILRGGDWDSTPPNLRSAARLMDTTSDHLNGFGFRMARTF